MSHPFGDLLSRYLHRKHGLSQSKLAEGILQDPSVITKMCKGRRLTGVQARERVLAMADWLRTQAAIETVEEANALLAAAGMAPLRSSEAGEDALLRQLQPQPLPTPSLVAPSPAVTNRLTNLPAALTSFIGRTHDLDDVVRSITTHRLVTLTGAGGVGKTRLATEAGIRLVQGSDASLFADGVWLVELADLSQPTLVAPAVVRCFKLPEQSGQTNLDLLQEYLADKQLLLILDNCEHLVDPCADLVEHLLQHCWRLHVLATSREELRIPGETIYPVLPLALPDPMEHDPERVLASSSAQLFVERSGAGQRTQQTYREDAATIARICRQLDGIPLALELAAPLTRSMPLSDIAAQLHDQMGILTNTYRTAIPRHQTMYRALVWSYRLLAPAEQQLLARLSVFAGGWMLEAAHAVCGGAPAADVLLSLQQLVAKSLVLEGDVDGRRRYRLLEPVRQFAQAQLVACGELDDIRRRHAAYFLVLAEEAEPEFHGPQQAMWLARLEEEYDNLRAALEWSLAGGSSETGMRLAAALTDFWNRRCYLSEGRRWLNRAITFADALVYGSVEPETARGAVSPTAALAKALHSAGNLAHTQEDDVRAEALYSASLTMARALGDHHRIARLLNDLGEMALHKGDTQRAMTLSLEGLALARTLGDRPAIAQALIGLNYIARADGDLQAAAAFADESLGMCRMLGDPRGEAWALHALGTLAQRGGGYTRAADLFAEALALARAVGDQENTTYLLYDLGRVLLEQHEPAGAAPYFGESALVSRDLGLRQGVAQNLTVLATIRIEQGKLPQAVRLLSLADVQWARATSSYWGADARAEHERTVTSVRAQLDLESFTTAWTTGRTLPLEQVIAWALEGERDPP